MMAAVGLTTVCMTLIYLGVFCDGSVHTFYYGTNEYTIHLTRAVGQVEARNICGRTPSSTLADVQDENLLEKFNEWLFSLNMRTNVHELWTKGHSSGFNNDYVDLAKRHAHSERIVAGYERIAHADCVGFNIVNGLWTLQKCANRCSVEGGCEAFLFDFRQGRCFLKHACNLVEKVNYDIDVYIPKTDMPGYWANANEDVYDDAIKVEQHSEAEACGVICYDMNRCTCFRRNGNTCWFYNDCRYLIDGETSSIIYTKQRHILSEFEQIYHHICTRTTGNPVRSKNHPDGRLDLTMCALMCSIAVHNCVAFEVHPDKCVFFDKCESLEHQHGIHVYKRYNTKCLMLSNKPLAGHPGYNVYNMGCSGARHFICEKPYLNTAFPSTLPIYPMKLREMSGWMARFDDYDYQSILTGVTVYKNHKTEELICITFIYGDEKTLCRGNHEVYPQRPDYINDDPWSFYPLTVVPVSETIMLRTGEFFNYAQIRTRSTWRFPVISQIILKTSEGRTFGPVGMSKGQLEPPMQNGGKPIMYASGISGAMLNQIQFHFFDLQVTDLEGITNFIASDVFTAYKQGDMTELMRINNKYQNMIPNLANRVCDVFTHFVVAGDQRFPYEWGCKLMLVLQQLDIYTASSDTLKKHLPRNLLKIAEFDSRMLLQVESKAQKFHDVLTQVVFTVTRVGSEIQNTTIKVNQDVANNLQDYFGTVAQFDKEIATADRDFITGRLETLVEESEQFSGALELRIRVMLALALAVTTADLAEAVMRLAAAIAKASNPIGWIAGGNDANDVSDELAAVARATRRLAQAVRLRSTLHVFTQYLHDLIEKVNRNENQLSITRLIVNKFLNATDAKRVEYAREFLIKYNDYKPHVKAFDVVYATGLLAAVVEEGCSLIDDATGTIANTLGLGAELLQIPATLGTKKPQTICTQLPAMIAKLEQMYFSVFDFQFELMDAFASIARENIVQVAAGKIGDIASVERIDVITATVGSLSYAMRTQNAAKSRCFVLEYQDGGRIPPVCKHLFFTDATLSKIIAYEGTVQSSTSERFGYIPMTPPDGKRTLTYLDVDELITNGVAYFQLPINDRAWMVKYGWLPNHAENETAYFVDKFEMFIPGLQCKGQKTYTMQVDVTSRQNTHLYKETAPPSYVIPEALYRFVYSLSTKKKKISCASKNIIDFQLRQNDTDLTRLGIQSVCVLSDGETKNDLKPSLYSNWIIKLRPPPGCKLQLKKPKQKKKKKNKKKVKAIKQPLITVRYRRVDILSKGINECYPNTRCGTYQNCIDEVLSYRCQDITSNP